MLDTDIALTRLWKTGLTSSEMAGSRDVSRRSFFQVSNP